MKISLPETLIILAAAACLGADQPSIKPVSAAVVPSKSGQPTEEDQIGNIKLTFSDGHSEVVTTDGKYMALEVSKKGNVGWIYCTGFDHVGYPMNEKLIIRTVDGKTKEFKPDGYPYIRSWGFTEDELAVVIMWGGRHSIPIFLRYTVATGKVTGEVSGVGDYNKLPKWAKPIAKGEASLENAE